MKTRVFTPLAFAFAGMMSFVPASGQAAPWESTPLRAEEAEVIQRMLEREEREVRTSSGSGSRTVARFLEGIDDPQLDLDGVKTWTLTHPERSGLRLSIFHDAEGRVIGLLGNGPWLQNETLRDFVNLPELRFVRVDHNSVHHQEPERGELYNAAGFDALADSKIASIRLTSGLNDAGLKEILKLKQLVALELFHVRVTETGLAMLRDHPTLKDLRVGLMGRAPSSSLEILATIPNLEKLRFNESYVTYENGLDHLKPLAGKLKSLDLGMSLVTRADLERVRSDHPALEITPSTPAEVVKGHRGVANQLARLDLPPELGEPLREALSGPREAR